MFGFFPHLVWKDDSFLWVKQYACVSILWTVISIWKESIKILHIYYLQAAACRLLLKVQLLDWVLLAHHLYTVSQKPPVELKRVQVSNKDRASSMDN